MVWLAIGAGAGAEYGFGQQKCGLSATLLMQAASRSTSRLGSRTMRNGSLGLLSPPAAASTLAPDAGLHIFHAFGSSGEVSMPVANVREHVIREGQVREEAGVLARMRRGIARLGLDPRGMVFSIGRGSPIGATLHKAKALRADLIVARKQRRSRNATAILGSVNGLLARSRCDMLIVPGGVPDACHAGTVMPPPARTAAGGGWQAVHRPARTRPSWPEAWHAPSPGAASSAGRDAMRLGAR